MVAVNVELFGALWGGLMMFFASEGKKFA